MASVMVSALYTFDPKDRSSGGSRLVLRTTFFVSKMRNFILNCLFRTRCILGTSGTVTNPNKMRVGGNPEMD